MHVGGGVMTGIEAWCLHRGLDVAVEVLAHWLCTESTNEQLQTGIDSINSKLDILIAAPYRQAVMHLKAGNLERGTDKLIEAMSVDELDLPARLLYCSILRQQGRYDLALDCYYEILECFGNVEGFVPPALAAAYKPKPGEFASRVEYIAHYPNFYPRHFYCVPAGIVTVWEYIGESNLDTFWDRITSAYDGKIHCTLDGLNGKRILEGRGRPLEVAALTTHYLAVAHDDQATVYRLRDGARMKTIPPDSIKSLFPSPFWRNVVTCGGKIGSSTQYGSAMIRPVKSVSTSSVGMQTSRLGGELIISRKQASPA
jgi:hypothetical protein